MRILVLILVIAALGGFWLAYKSGDETPADSGLNPGDAPVEAVQPADPGGATQLVETGGPAERTTGTDPALVKPERVATGKGILGTAVYGRVSDPDGTPVPNAEVILTRGGIFGLAFVDAGSPTSDTDLTTKTNKEGQFHFTDVEPFDSYTVVARHPRFGRAEESDINVLEGDPVEVEVMMGGGLRLYGVVTDGSGAGVPNANVIVGLTALGAMSAEDKNAVRTTTNAQGTYDFSSLAQGNYVLTVTADGYGTVSFTQLNLAGEADIEKNVALEVAQMIGGRVTSTSGEAVPNALVQAYSLARRQDTTRTQAKTDDKGEFVFRDVPSGSYTLLVRADAYETKREPRVETGDMSVAIVLAPNPTVSGTVVDAATNQPLRRFTVQLRQEVQGAGVSAPLRNTKIEVKDDEGRFTLTCPKPGDYIVGASSAGHSENFSQRFTVTDGQHLEGVQVRMRPGGEIRGRVVDAQGRPVSGALVASHDTDWTDDPFMRSLEGQYPTHASTVKTRSNSDGEFRLKSLTPATYLVEIKHKDFATRYQREIIVSEGRETKVGDIVIERGASVTGMVNGPSGSPLAGARVQLQMESLSATTIPVSYTAKTSKEGKYRLDHVKAGTYQVHATRPQNMNDSSPFQIGVDVKNTKRKITVDEGGTYSGIDFTLTN